ncbi:hypothetical protein SAMN05192574_102287 [Mucilaginibacter gossypiicola]|uniref:Uncharacterized protein n=1 Tax=Mucilaginibacter gossypiicola TaxID=551995 RepID=A0A1H8DCZ0_9SPHI|nr:hypothetical protein [Mucilaginibacter gossypiicola]SEN04654.1 hypothetical protein SAMN05192574_102287 [Mucilaginibacter gossypiicola]
MPIKMIPENKAGCGGQVPPAREHVLVFFDQAGFEETEAYSFFYHYEELQWKGLKGGLIRNWKTKANEWIWELKLLHPYLRFK